MKDIDKRNVEDFLKEGNVKQLLEFLRILCLKRQRFLWNL